MANKDILVEELAKDLEINSDYIVEYGEERFNYAKVAKALYNIGYRRVEKGSIILTPEKLKQEPKILTIDEAQKERTKEILQTLYNNKGRPQFIEVYIRTLAEKFGVEVK